MAKANRQFSLEDTEWMVWRIETVALLEQAMVEKFTEGLAYDILYNVAYTMGKKAFQRYVEEAQSDKVEDILTVFTRRKTNTNWGQYSFPKIDVKNTLVVVRVVDCFEKKAGVFKNCPFTKGYICGFFAAMFKTEVTAAERHSVDFCEFHVKGNKTV